MFKNVATKVALFAFDTTTGAAKTGDATNISAYVSKDYGGVTQLADTSAAEMDAVNAKGWYVFDVAQSETDADALLFTGKSSTLNIAIAAQYVFTTSNPWSTVLEGSYTAEDLLRIITATLAGKTTVDVHGDGSSTVVFRDVSDLSDIVTGTAVGSERTAVTISP